MPTSGQIEIRFTGDLVAAFAAATGDYSPIHMDAGAAERMPFRERIVHGCLVLSSLRRIQPPPLLAGRYVLSRIQAQFLHPVYIAESIVLDYDISRSTAGLKLDFRFCRQASGQAVITGSAWIASTLADPSLRVEPSANTMALKETTFDEVQRDDRESIVFSYRPDVFDQLLPSENEAWLEAPFFELAMLSPLVGMRLPGKHAILSQIMMAWPDTWRPAKRLEGRVESTSRSVRALKLGVRFFDSRGAESATANVQVRMQRPQIPQPSLVALAERLAVDPDLVGKTVLITGATGGLGQSLARILALRGANLILHTRNNAATAEVLREEIASLGREAMVIRGELGSESGVNDFIEAAESCPLQPNGLINNAVGRYQAKPFLDTGWEEVSKELAISVMAPFLLTRWAIGKMLPDGGSIVHVGSIAVDSTPPEQVAYVVSKSALQGICHAVHAEFMDSAIRSFYVAPPLMKTDLTANLSAGALLSALKGAPDGRVVEPWRIASGICDLLRDSPENAQRAGRFLRWSGRSWEA